MVINLTRDSILLNSESVVFGTAFLMFIFWLHFTIKLFGVMGRKKDTDLMIRIFFGVQ